MSQTVEVSNADPDSLAQIAADMQLLAVRLTNERRWILQRANDLAKRVLDAEGATSLLVDQIEAIKQAAIEHGVNDEVAAAIAHAVMVAQPTATKGPAR